MKSCVYVCAHSVCTRRSLLFHMLSWTRVGCREAGWVGRVDVRTCVSVCVSVFRTTTMPPQRMYTRDFVHGIAGMYMCVLCMLEERLCSPANIVVLAVIVCILSVHAATATSAATPCSSRLLCACLHASWLHTRRCSSASLLALAHTAYRFCQCQSLRISCIVKMCIHTNRLSERGSEHSPIPACRAGIRVSNDRF